jgi:hypothetical protein
MTKRYQGLTVRDLRIKCGASYEMEPRSDHAYPNSIYGGMVGYLF